METPAAVEAKEAALEKMRNGDFSGALKLAVEARSLYPGMGGLDRMIIVCNVHCAAAAGGGGDGKDWYKILDMAAEADEAAVRRQCGRMAVALHPDKNGLPGATEAFQLFLEARDVLTDSERRSVYDSMCRANAMRGQWAFGFSRFQDNEVANGFARFRGNKPNTDKPVASGDDASGVLDDGFSRFLNDEILRMGGNGFVGSGGHNWESGFSTVQNGGRGRGRDRGGGRGRGRGSKVNKPSSIKANVLGSGDRPKRPRGRPRGTGSKQNKPSSDKLVESQGDATKVLDGEVEISNFDISRFLNDDFSTLQNGAQGRGSELNERNTIKQNVVASVNATTNDKPKRPRGRPLGRPRGRGRGQGRAPGHDEGEIAKIPRTGENDQGEIAKSPKACESPTTHARGADKNEVREFPLRPDSEILEYTVAEFNDFERERSRDCFKAGQVWAVYDTLDAMPRFYAMINGIILDDHKLQITWLEPLPEDEAERKWLYRGMPASSGRFKQGYNEVIQDYAVFSHLVKWKRDAVLRNVYAIQPQKGETWAVFKNWDTIRSKTLDELEYEVVEIMSDYYSEFGVSVEVLDRIEGFMSVFGRRVGRGVGWVVIGAKDRLRLSHKIPSLDMPLDGVKHFELDPAALPKRLSFGST